MAGRNWTRTETLAAFALYCRMPFGRLHARNPEIIQIATKLGRTPSAVAMKCCNLASLDDTHQSRGVKGLQKVSTADRLLWAEFFARPEAVSFEAATTLAELESPPALPQVDLPLDERVGQVREQIVRRRVNQYFFRNLILIGYNEACAVCRLPLPELLIASHIVPWSADETVRMNPRNGICLCGTHDRAFEQGLLRIERSYVISIHVPERYRGKPSVVEWLLRYEGECIQLPHRWIPDPELLDRKLAMVTAG
ncbi:MAG: HNH endonuclease [Planctomycetaceae bacterium]|nr:HNH endonuclease [Planctomycetaceae bacterium]